MSNDEIARLRRADPAPEGALAGAARSVEALRARDAILSTAGPRRPRRRIWPGALAGVAGLVGLAALFVVLLVASPSGDRAARADDLRIGALERLRTDADRLPAAAESAPFLDAPVDPATVRLVRREGGASWYLMRPLNEPDSVCLYRVAGRELPAATCDRAPLMDGLPALAIRRDPSRPGAAATETLGIVVPDGVERVVVAGRVAAVTDNLAVLTLPRPLPVTATVEGPAAAAFRGAPRVAAGGSSIEVPLVIGGAERGGQRFGYGLLERDRTPRDAGWPAGLTGRAAGVAPASARLLATRGAVRWLVGRVSGAGDVHCLVAVRGAAPAAPPVCRPLASPRGFVGLVVSVGPDAAGLVPDGIEAVTAGAATVAVRDNAFVTTTDGAPLPGAVTLTGPAAAGMTPLSYPWASAGDPGAPHRADVSVAGGGLAARTVVPAPGARLTSPALLRASALDRPQVAGDRVARSVWAGEDGHGATDPASYRLVAREGGDAWYLALGRGRPLLRCIVHVRAVNPRGGGPCVQAGLASAPGMFQSEAVGRHRGVPALERRWELTGMVADGVERIRLGRVEGVVHDNFVRMRITGYYPQTVTVIGPAARLIPGTKRILASGEPAVDVPFRTLGGGGAPQGITFSVLDRPPASVGPVPGIRPGSLRAAGGPGRAPWFAAIARDGDGVCIVRLPVAGASASACAPRDDMPRRGLVAVAAGEGETEIGGLVPDGIDSVTIADRTAPVRDNVFVVRLRGAAPGYAILTGPAAPALRTPRLPGAIVMRVGGPPAVAVALRLG